MTLTERQKGFIIKNESALIELFEKRVTELKEEIIDSRPDEAPIKIGLVRELKVMVRDIRELCHPTERVKQSVV